MAADPKEKIILALDVPDLDAGRRLLDRLSGELRWVKVGLQLFTSAGPPSVLEARERGLEVFLDLKFHDIPNTARHAVASARELGAAMTTIHLAGGPAMVDAAVAEAGGMLVLGVTVLTSMDEESLAATGIRALPSDHAFTLAGMGIAEGLRGVVASPQEVLFLRENFGPELAIVCPGIRPSDAGADDQRRSATPAEAIRNGASYLVIGRPISAAADPREALRRIAAEIAQAGSTASA